ncbi:zf-HC2 domain-containing protein [Microbacterium sp. NPDC089695]|uniref:zf-HC2 domain-containing protein n=1 Tax=Microbacterium sp. NPDC089695 TaxID=3364198 RepID=UPI00383019B1
MNHERGGVDAEHRRMAEWDAAYVLGALTPTDRRLFEQHMQGCAICRDAVGELAGMPGLLARAGAASLVAAPEVPDPPHDLLSRTVDRIDRARSQRTRRTIIAGLTAAAVVVAAVAVPIALTTDPPDAAVAFGLTASTGMTVDLEFHDVEWGTRIVVDCDYPSGSDWRDDDGLWSYALVLTDDDGTATTVASWLAVPGGSMSLDAASSLRVDEIASVSILTGDGDVLLEESLGG